MTINTDDKQVVEIITLLGKLGIPVEDCALAEKYIRGEVGDEVLDQFQRIDFAAAGISRQAEQELNRLEYNLGQSGMRDTRTQMINVLFAIGHGSCSALFSNRCVDCERYKATVIYIEKSLEDRGYLSQSDLTRFTMQDLLDEINNKPENLERFIDQIKGEGAKYYLTVLAVYFGAKYPETEALRTESLESGKGLIDAGDIPFMQMYEEGLLGCLDEWLSGQGCAAHEKITAAIREHRLTTELCADAGQCSYTIPDCKKLCMIGSLAYLNHMFSDVLRDIVRVCLTVATERVFLAMYDVLDKSSECKGRIRRRGGDCGELFWIEPETYIRQVAFDAARERGYYYEKYVNTVQIPILKNRLKTDQESYLRALDQDGYFTLMAKRGYYSDLQCAISTVNLLKDILKAENPALYEQVDAAKPEYDRIIRHLVRDTPHAEQAREYLRGRCSIAELYPYEAEYSVEPLSLYYVQEHKRHWNDEEFLNRCKAYLVLTGSDKTTIIEDNVLEAFRKNVNPEWEHEKVAEEVNKLWVAQVEKFFQMLDGEHLDIAHQLKGFVSSYTTDRGLFGRNKEMLLTGAANVFARYLDSERRGETVEAFANTIAEGRYLALCAMRKDAAKNQKEILSYAADTSKLVRNELLEILYAHRDWEDAIKALLEGKKAAQRETAVQVLAHWQEDGGNYNEILLQAIAKEKNAKVRALLQNTLNIQESALPQETLSKEDLVKQMHKGNRKKGLAWAYEKPFSTVHRRDGAVADEVYLQAVLLCYASQEKNGVSKNAQILSEELVSEEFAIYMNELFDKWLAAGAESKKRWVLYAASIHGGEDIVQRLQHQIQEWPQQARGAIAAEAVKALALSPSPRALLLVDNIARKFKFKQVKAAAGDALAFAAAELGITREELSDRIVPTLGFDEKMQRIFDYGERQFKVVLTSALDIEVYDDNDKKLKNLPAPGKKDDPEKAAAAYEAFKQMKKQMKTTVSSQKTRLEYALSVKREWSVDAWEALFVRNPLMHQFAIGLIWGVYEGNKLVQSFRYMEDGSFNTQDEEEYVLPGGARISLVHPLELSEEERATWREQLADYEITQPFAQLDREVYVMTDEEAGRKSLERFGGCIVNDLSLNGKLTGFGWYRGSVQDGGGFYVYYREDAEPRLGVELHFSGAYVGGLNDDVTIYDVRFYQAGAVEHGSYVYDEVDKERAYLIKDVPPRYFSEIVLQIAHATASSTARDEEWKKKVRTLE